MRLPLSKRAVAVAGVALAASAVAGVLTARVEPLGATATRAPDLGRLGEELAPPPGAVFLPLGDSLTRDGWRRQMAYAVTDAKVAAVAERYANDLRGRGLRVRHDESEREHVVIAADGVLGVVRTVVVSAEDDGRTRVVASVSDPLEEDPVARAPAPPGCDEVSRTGAVDGALATELLVLRCAATVQDVGAFYDARLGGNERRVLLEPTVDRKSLRVSYLGARLQVTVSADQQREAAPLTLVSVSWQQELP